MTCRNHSRSRPHFRLAPMSMEHCRAICAWRYEPPYHVYQWEAWEKIHETGYEFGDAAIREAQYASVLDENGELAGFAQFFPLEGVTRLGLGMRPDLCGRGFGPAFVSAIVEEARKRRPHDEIDLEVLVWNERARIAYERAGFAITDRYERNTPAGIAEFYCMAYVGRGGAE